MLFFGSFNFVDENVDWIFIQENVKKMNMIMYRPEIDFIFWLSLKNQ